MKNDEEIKIGDIVTLLFINKHNSIFEGYKPSITFDDSEIGKDIEILDIHKTYTGSIAYEVMSNKGLTYLSRDAFCPIHKKPESEEEEDMSYLIQLFDKLNIK